MGTEGCTVGAVCVRSGACLEMVGCLCDALSESEDENESGCGDVRRQMCLRSA
jgi:hypothetical protein